MLCLSLWDLPTPHAGSGWSIVTKILAQKKMVIFPAENDP
jgi:hypothetical protein